MSTDTASDTHAAADTRRLSVAVVVPVYRRIPSHEECLSLRQLFTRLHGTPIVFLHPGNMDLQAYQEWPADPMPVDPQHLSSSQSYSRLLLTPNFYRYFIDYEFVLIHQTDAFICQGDLTRFTGAGFDYVGAPWTSPRRCPLWCLKGARFLSPPWMSRSFSVGNGGLSLRRVSKSIDVIEQNRYYAAAARLTGTHEDIFFSSLRGDGPNQLKIPSREFALTFAFDENPRRCYADNGFQLPFGLHNPWGYDREFFFAEVLWKCSTA